MAARVILQPRRARPFFGRHPWAGILVTASHLLQYGPRYSGRDHRLTDVEGTVIKEIIA